MEKMFLLLVLCVVVRAMHKHHPKFPKALESPLKKVTCTSDHEHIRNNIMEKAQCGEPKEVFIDLPPSVAHEQVSPGSVWVKRCVGLCDFDYGSKCVPTATVIRHIPVRIYNAKTNKETCSMYPVEEHVSCGCCSLSPEECASPQVFNRRKCSCQCPNLEERRACLQKKNQNMRWNRSKCVCEDRKRT